MMMMMMMNKLFDITLRVYIARFHRYNNSKQQTKSTTGSEKWVVQNKTKGIFIIYAKI
jgi:hypothetical protein